MTWEHRHRLSLHLHKDNDRTVERILVCEALLVRHKINSVHDHQSHLLDLRSRLSMPGRVNHLLCLDRSQARSECDRKVVNQVGQVCALGRHPPKPKLEHRLHRLDMRMLHVSSAHNLIFGRKVLLYRLSHREAGRRYQVLCNHVHKVLPDKRALSDRPVTCHKKDLESHIPKRTVRRLVRLLVRRFLRAQDSDGNNSSNSNKNNRKMYSHHRHNIDSSCQSCSLLPIESSLQFQTSPNWKQHNRTAAVLDPHALRIVNLRSLKVALHQPRSIRAMLQQLVA